MIHIKYKKERGNFSMKIEGHAEYDEVGRDIVCAGISTLYYTMLNKAIEITESKQGIEVEYFGVPESGETEIKIAYSDASSLRIVVDTMISTILLGMRMIADQYPENVRIT